MGRAQHTSGHEDAQQIELKEAALFGVIGQAVGEHDIIDGIGTHKQAERAQRAGMVGRGDRGKRPQGHDGRDRAEDSTTFQYGDELPRAHAAGGFGFVLGREGLALGCSGTHATDDLSDQRGGEHAIVTGVATIQQHHQNGDVTKQSDTTAHQSIAVGAGRHECTDDQYHRAERELLAGDESDILIGQADAVAQADADDQTAEGTHQRHHDGTHNAHTRFGDGQHEDDQQRAAEHLQHASGQNQRNQQLADVEVGDGGVEVTQRQPVTETCQNDPQDDVDRHEHRRGDGGEIMVLVPLLGIAPQHGPRC